MVAILGDDLFELYLTLDGAMEEYDDVDLPQSNAINKALKVLREKLANLDGDTQNTIDTEMMEKSIVATSLEDLRPAEVPIKHCFELDGTNPIYYSARRLAPLHIDIVRKELYKMLEAGIITPSSSAWSFPVVIVSKKEPALLCLLPYLNHSMKADRLPLAKKPGDIR